MAHNHVIHLGKLVGNLQSLEALLRVYLIRVATIAKAGKQAGSPYWSLSTGDTIPEDDFSNYDSLGTLITKFNNDISGRDPLLLVDMRIVEIRDLLAHGRVAADAPDTTTLRIIKFSKPSQGKVSVVASALMDDQWFTQNIDFVRNEIEKLGTALNRYVA